MCARFPQKQDHQCYALQWHFYHRGLENARPKLPPVFLERGVFSEPTWLGTPEYNLAEHCEKTAELALAAEALTHCVEAEEAPEGDISVDLTKEYWISLGVL